MTAGQPKHNQRNNPRKKTRAHVANEVKLDVKNPIPFENPQTFSSISQHRYIPFLYPDDTYAQQLLEARLISVTNNACINTKTDYCAGLGFEDKDGRDLDQKIIDWLGQMNRKADKALSLNKKAFAGIFTWGNQPIEVVRFKAGGTPYFYVYVHNLLEWRLCAENSDGDVTHAIRSKLFRRQGIATSEQLKEIKPIPLYRRNAKESDNWLKDGDVERTMIWYSNQVTGFDHYGLPSNVASMIYQLLEYKGARYNLDNFDNNMVLGGLLALKGQLGQIEANRIAKQVVSTHTGDGKRGRVAVVASEEGIDGSSFHSFDTTKDGSFTTADEKWMQKIILANEWDAVLAGLISPSTMGKGSGFITKILELKLNTVIRPAQEDIMQNVWNDIFAECQKWTKLPFDKFNIGIKNSIDISGLTDVDITPAVQVNEVRQAKGLPADDKMEGVYMNSAKAKQEKEGGEDVQP
jgi:hypothetical protein